MKRRRKFWQTNSGEWPSLGPMKRFLSLRTILWTTVALPLVLASCKKSEPIGVLYVVGERAPVFSDAEVVRNPAFLLKRGESVDILAERVEDERFGDRRLWYRVRQGERDGFVSYDETLVRNNVMAFLNVKEPQVALVTGDSLRLRRAPGLQSGVAGTLRRGDIVDVLMEGSMAQRIDNRRAIWLKLRTKAGVEGFAFGGYLERAAAENAEELKSFAGMQDFEITSGFACITAEEPQFFGNPALKTAVELNHDMGGLRRLPESGECAAATAQASADGVKYYRIENNRCGEGACAEVVAWIPADQAEFTTDLVAYGMAQAKNQEFTAQIQAIAAWSRGHGLQPDPSSARVEPIALPSEAGDNSLYSIGIEMQSGGYRHPANFIVSCSGEECVTITNAQDGKVFSYNGRTYLTTSFAERMYMSTTVHIYKGNAFVRIGSFGGMEAPEVELPYFRVSDWDDQKGVQVTHSYRLDGERIIDEESGQPLPVTDEAAAALQQ